MPSAPFRWWRVGIVLGVLAFVLGAFLPVSFVPPLLPHAAIALAIRREQGFSQVQVVSMTNGQIVVFAPDEMPTADKARLQRLADHYHSGGPVLLRYLKPISDSPK